MKLKNNLKNYEPVSLLSSIASLMLDSRNMEHFLTLQQASHIAICSLKSNDPNLSLKELKNIHSLLRIINNCEETSSISYQQDPPEELFTDNVLFHGGNYTVFPGITSGGVYTLELLLKSVCSNNSSLFRESSKLIDLSIALLKISNEIAIRAEIKPWSKFPRSQSKYGSISHPKDLQRFKKALTFTFSELKDLLSPEEFKEVENLSLTLEDYPKSDYDPESSLLSLKPIIKCNDNFIVVDPSGILSCLRNEIIAYYANSENSRIKLLEEIKKAELSYLKQNFMFLGFDTISNQAQAGEKPDFYEELLFSLDSKRICFVQVIFDNLKNYDSTKAFPYIDSINEFKYLEDRLKEVDEKFLKVFFKNFKVLHILIQVPMGRTTVGGFNYVPSNSVSINFSSPDLDVVSGLKLNDKYLLFNFACAIEEKRKQKVMLQSFSHLDMLQMFLKNNQSFYMTDDFRPNMINFSTDFGRSLREEKVDKEQKQNAYHYTGSLFPVIKKHIDGNIPIYVSLNTVKYGYEELVKTNSYIWCKVKAQSKNLPIPQLTEAIAYWCWQITKELSIEIPSCLVDLSFSEEFLTAFTNHDIPKLDITREEIISKQDLHCYTKVYTEKPVIKIQLQKDAIGLMFFSKNEFDRCLVKTLLSIFDAILNNPPSREETINKMVNTVAPYGNKKILTIQSSTSSPYLLEQPRGSKIRVSEYFSGKYLDELGDHIKINYFNNNPLYGQIAHSDRRKVQELCKSFYQDKLDSLLANFNTNKLLSALFDLNENLIFHEKVDNIHFFTSIACYYSIHEKIKKDQKTNSLKQTASLCTRFLIEYLYCTNYDGKEEITELELQELLSIAGQYVSWGLATDELRCGVFDHQYGYLKSDRIGLSDSAKNGMMGFANKKLEEETISRYSRKQSKILTPDTHYELYQDAFKAEYQIDYKVFANIVSDISNTPSTYSRHIIKKSEIINIDNEYTNVEIEKTLELLILPLRENWDDIPDGFLPHEIFPWRFKRRLSCIQKPVLIANESEDPEFYIYRNTILRAVEYLFHQITTANFPSEYFTSKKMKSFVGKVAKDLGKIFEDEVKAWLEAIPNEDIQVFSGVEIGPNHRLKNNENIGDVDHLLINNKRKEIVVMELKAISGSKTPVEISTEIKKHFENDDLKKKTSISKHLTRYNWIKNNLDYVKQELKLSKNKYKVFQIFVTDETIPSTFLRTLPKNVASFESFRWHKYSDFRKKYK